MAAARVSTRIAADIMVRSSRKAGGSVGSVLSLLRPRSDVFYLLDVWLRRIVYQVGMWKELETMSRKSGI
jgi:hypothetical protein